MPDDVNIFQAPSTGPVIATDEISSRHFQRVKLIRGGDGVNNGDVSSTNPLPVQAQGEVAHATPAGSNPVLVAGQARGTTNPPKVTSGNAARLIADLMGRLITSPQGSRELTGDQRTTLVNASETTILAAGAAGVFRDCTLLVLANTAASAATVDIRSVSGGTIKLTCEVPANDMRVIPFEVPLKQNTAASVWTAQGANGINITICYVEKL